MTHRCTHGLVGDAKNGYNVAVLGLRDELCDGSDVAERPLSISETHRAVQYVDRAKLARVIPTILATRKCVEVQVDTKAILPSPFNGFQEVAALSCKQMPWARKEEHTRPRNLLEEGLAIPSLDGPVTDGDADVIEAGTSDFSKVSFRLAQSQ